MKKIKLYYLVSDIRKEIGGKAFSTINLCNSISHLIYLELLCVRHNFDLKKINFKLKMFKHFAQNPFYFSFGLFRYLKNNINNGDIIHSRGLWHFSNVLPFFIKKIKKIKFVSSPLGMLNEYALNESKFKKTIAFHFLFQKNALNHTDYFHATSEKELNEIRKNGYNQPVVIIPESVDETILFNILTHFSAFVIDF